MPDGVRGAAEERLRQAVRQHQEARENGLYDVSKVLLERSDFKAKVFPLIFAESSIIIFFLILYP